MKDDVTERGETPAPVGVASRHLARGGPHAAAAMEQHDRAMRAGSAGEAEQRGEFGRAAGVVLGRMGWDA